MRFGVGLLVLVLLGCGRKAPKEPVATAAPPPEPVPACAIRGPVYTTPAPGPIDPKPTAAAPAEPKP
jgi:hypothetical protein